MILRKKKTPQLNYFVSIGSGLNQIPLITEAKNLGLPVIGVDARSSAAGFYLCDLKIQESIENYDAIYKKLLELLVDGDIRGIMTKSYGPAIITTSYLTEKFSIPFLPFANSGSFINKRKMKSVFIEHKIQTPRLIPLTSRMKPEKLSAGSYPVIIKPNIGHAKKNVRLACDAAELKQYCSNQSQSGQDCIIEKFAAGEEMIAAGMINNKRYHLV